MKENKKEYISPDLTLAYIKTSSTILNLSKEESDGDNSYGGYIPIPSSNSIEY